MDKYIIIGASGILVSAALFYDANKRKKAKESIDSLADHINIDLEDPVIKEYVERVIIKEFHKAGELAANKAADEFSNDIRSAVSDEIDLQVEGLSEKVIAEINRQVEHLDISKIKDEALREAKEMAAEALKEDMKDILDNYKEGLDNLAVVYRAIADKKASAVDIPGLKFNITV